MDAASTEQRETGQEQYGDNQNNEPNSDIEEEENDGNGEPRVSHTPSTASESEVEEPVPERIQERPHLTPDTNEHTPRRSLRDRRPATRFTYDTLGQPTVQGHPSVSSAEVYGPPQMAHWGMQVYPFTHYSVPTPYPIPSPYWPSPFPCPVFQNMPTY